MEISENTEPEPTRRLFKTNETSSQSTTLVQNETERGILVFRDELSGLLVKCNREGGQDERVYFLEGWNGAGSYTGFKIGRGLIDAKKICISLLAGIQADKLKRYLYQAMQAACCRGYCLPYGQMNLRAGRMWIPTRTRQLHKASLISVPWLSHRFMT